MGICATGECFHSLLGELTSVLFLDSNMENKFSISFRLVIVSTRAAPALEDLFNTCLGLYWI